MSSIASPDQNAEGLLSGDLDPLRYDWTDVFGPQDVYEAPAIISGWLPAGSKVLDVGCGGGTITALVGAGKDCTIMGVEPDPERSAAARARGLNVVTGYLDEAFLAANGPFDVVLFTDVLEHLPRPREMIDLALKGLRPGGYIIASVPNVAHWTVRFRLLIGKFNYAPFGIMDATHLRWFTRKSFAAFFEPPNTPNPALKVVAQGASAGMFLGEYSRFPFKLLPRGLRRRLVQFLSQTFPGLFGCQNLVMAQRVET